MKANVVFILVIFFFNCEHKIDTPLEELNKQETKKNINAPVAIGIEKVGKTNFNVEILSNGKLQANSKAEIPFELTERIVSIKVKNGDKVVKGQLLAVLDNTNTTIKLQNANIELDKAKIQLQDILLGFGYNINDTTNIESKLLKSVKIQSNYSKALAALKEAVLNDSKTKIRAPISGVVANLFAQTNNLTSNYQNTLCTIIDNSRMQVVFPVLESEISKVKKGSSIEVYQYALPETIFKGEIVAVNPVVDIDGMVQVTGLINNVTSLFDGMNVKIRLIEVIPDKIVVPKEALLLREGKYVVFVLKEDEAYWTYVEKGLENNSHVIINKGLKEGENVIVSGNTNLAHQTKVKVVD